jgi:hypothetical protein
LINSWNIITCCPLGIIKSGFHQQLGAISINIEVTFRLLNLDKFQAITLTREIAGATYDNHPKNDCFVGLVCLNKNLDNLDDLNIFYVRQQISLQDCDICIVITPANITDTVATPMFVNKVLKHIDCQLTFSFNLSKTTDTL